MKFISSCVLVCICFLSLSFVSNAQTAGENLVITVTNQLGEVIVDAEVTLFVSDKAVKTERTNKQGVTAFSSLTGASYRLSVTSMGFSEYKSETIAIGHGERKVIQVTLEVASVEAAISVGGNDEADASRYSAGTEITQRQIENLADDPRDLERVLRSIAGKSITGEQMQITVDGVPGAPLPPRQVIEHIRVNQNIYSAQYKGPTGGGIEIFTRSNVDKFRGSIGLNFADSHFNAADPFLGRRVPFQARSYSFVFSGPINKRTSFVLNVNRDEADSSAVINALTLDSDLRPVSLNETIPSPTRFKSFSLTVNSDLNKGRKISMLYYSAFTNGQGQNAGGLMLPDRADETSNKYHFFRIADTYLIGTNLVSQTRFSIDHTAFAVFGNGDGPAINVLDSFFGGSSPNNNSDGTLNFSLSNDTVWQKGKFELGFGARVRGQRVNRSSRSNFGGIFSFSGRFAPVLDANDIPVTDDNGDFSYAQIDSLESYRRTLRFRQLGYTNQQTRELGGGASQFSISAGDSDISASQYDIGLYLQSNYKIGRSLAAIFGIRYDNQTNISSNLDVAPRFGLVWAPQNDAKKGRLRSLPRISGGIGLFYTRYASTNILNILLANDPGRSQYLTNVPQILDIFPLVPTIELLQQSSLPRSRRLIETGFRTPLELLFNINAVKNLPGGFSVNLTFVRSRISRFSVTRNINAPLAGSFDPQNPQIADYPFGYVGNIYATGSKGKSNLTRFAAVLNLPEKHVSGNIRYSFLSSKNDYSAGSGSPFDPYDFGSEYGSAPNDGVHNLSGFFQRRMPFGFVFEGDFSISSGTRFNIITGRDTNGDGIFDERPAFADDLNKPGLITTEYGILDPDPAATGTSVPRNLGRGPVRFAFNSGVSKTFGFGADKSRKQPPKRTLRFSVRGINIFNVLNKSNPVGNMSSPNFLRSLSVGTADGMTIINGIAINSLAGRSMSFGLTFSF